MRQVRSNKPIPTPWNDPADEGLITKTFVGQSSRPFDLPVPGNLAKGRSRCASASRILSDIGKVNNSESISPLMDGATRFQNFRANLLSEKLIHRMQIRFGVNFRAGEFN